MRQEVLEILSLSKDERGDAVRKISNSELGKFFDAVKKLSEENLINTARYNLIFKTSKPSDDLDNDAHISILRTTIIGLANQFPEPDNLELALDREFSSQEARFDAIIDDIHEEKLPKLRLHELLHESIYIPAEENFGTPKYISFLTYAAPELIDYVLDGLIEDLINCLNRSTNLWAFYRDLKNHNGIGDTTLNLIETYLENFGFKNQAERLSISNENKGILLSYSNKEQQNSTRTRDHHTFSTHKSADESNVRAFGLMIKEGFPTLEATFEPETKPRKVTFSQNGAFMDFINDKLEKLKDELTEIKNLSNEDLYNKYYRYRKELRLQNTDYKDLAGDIKTKIDKELQGVRFKTKAASRFVENMFNDGECNTGTALHFRTDTTLVCGMTVEQIIATAYWACDDSENFRKGAKEDPNTPKVNRLLLIDKLHDARRGYDIDRGRDKPLDNEFPENVGRDNHRCSGGSVNSIASALKSTHSSYNVISLIRSDLEKEIKSIFNYIIQENIEKLKSDKFKDNILYWNKTGIIKGDLKDFLKKIFNEKHLKNFEENFKGYISDDEFESVLENVYKQLDLPKTLKKKRSLESLNTNQIFDSIAADKLPLILAHLEKGHISTLNYLSGLDGKKSLIDELFSRLDFKTPESHTVLSFLSLSNLPLQYTLKEIFIIRGRYIRLTDLAPLKPCDIGTLLSSNDLIRDCITENNVVLLEFCLSHIDFSPDELDNGCGFNNEAVIHWAVGFGYTNVVKKLLELGADVNNLHNHVNSPLLLAVELGDIETVEVLLSQSNINPNVTNEIYNDDTVLHIALKAIDPTEISNFEAVSLLLVRNGMDVTAKNNHGVTPLELAKRKDGEFFETFIKEALKVANHEQTQKINDFLSTNSQAASISK